MNHDNITEAITNISKLADDAARKSAKGKRPETLAALALVRVALEKAEALANEGGNQ